MRNFFKTDKRILVGAGAIMLAALLWSLDGVFIRPKFYTVPAEVVVFLEHILGFIFLSPFIIFGWQKIKKLRMKDWGAVIWVSVFGGLLGTLMITKAFFAAMDGEVTFATVIILQKLQPFFALIMARLILKERLKPKFYVWAIVAIMSAYFLAFGQISFNLLEIEFISSPALFAILAAFAFGSSTIFGKRIVNHLNFKIATALRFGFTSLLALGLLTLTRNWLAFAEINSEQWGYLFLIVFTSGAGAMFIYYFGLKRVPASTATIYELFWPLSAVILDYVLNKNVLNGVQIIASLVLLITFYKVIKLGKVKKFEFTANIVSGAGRGERIGWPTINLDKVDLDIDYGVYLVESHFYSGKGGLGIEKIERYQGLLHFGPRETFSEPPALELFIPKYVLDIRKKRVKIKIREKIRDIKKFSNSKELKKQLERDLKRIKNN